jgi:uncharacterized membrane protein YphA (DoxX/SURF4 family)
MFPTLLALAEEDELPNYDAIALSPGVGWFLFGAVICLALFFLAHREAWRKLWLRMDDPRPMAAMRILFGFCALCNVNGLWELFGYLFTDEGIFDTSIAQHYRAKNQFAGFGDGTAETEPWGFFSFGAFVEWLKGPNYSLLLFDSSPTFFWTYLVIFEIAMVMFIVGWQTRWIKWVAWFLYMGIILRNTLFWEATENVYRVFFFYLLMSRCHEGWSVDNWLRCRRLAKQGRLSVPGGPGDGAGAVVDGKLYEPIYRPIPSWPRLFVMLNVAMLYCATGTLKNGPIWNRGDAFYYAFNLDHFYRLPPQNLSAYFGTTFFKLSTWVTHWWEALFPLLMLGLILRWHRREKIPPLRGWQLWMARLGLGGFVAWFYAIILYSYPVHYRAPKEGVRLFGTLYQGNDAIPVIQTIVAVAVPLLCVMVVWGYRWLRDRQDVPVERRRRAKWLDLDWVCRWVLGRRFWLMMGLIFHGHLILTMNIGWFSPGLLACYVAFLNGDELAYLTTKIGQFFNKTVRIPMPEHVRAGKAVPSADLRLPPVPDTKQARGWKVHRDGYQPSWALLGTFLGLAVLGIVRRISTDEDMWVRLNKLVENTAKFELPIELREQVPVINANWFVLMIIVLALVGVARRRSGYEFNPWFSPVILLTAWLGSVLAERELLGMIWVVLAVGVLGFGAYRIKAPAPAPIPVQDPQNGRLIPPWAYGPLGRSVASIVIIYHLCAVATTQFPEKDSWSTFRGDVGETFRYWRQTTQTEQGWGMFAPNPPRANAHLRVTVTDKNGEIYDLNTDVYACFMPGATQDICDAVYPIPWIWYTRQRKMNRRIAGSEGGAGEWYQKWHARWVCRQWELEHGELPRRVELYKITYPIPSPEEVFLNPYDAKTQYNAKGSHKLLHTTECAASIFGQLPNEIRRRHGLPEVDEKTIRTWNKHRCSAWEKKLIDEAREKEGEVDILDPRFDVCPDMPAEVRKAKFERGDEDLLLEDDAND